MTHGNQLMTIDEVAKLLRVRASTIRSWIRRGLLTAYGLPRARRFKYEEVMAIRPVTR